METKDWIQIGVEIICNGIILAIFGKWIDVKLKKTERKEETHAEIVNSFFDELANLNKALITVNYTVQLKKISDIDEIMNLLEENVLKQWIKIITYYDTYRYDLEKFEVDYNKVEKSWNEFVQQKEPQMLGIKLEEFKKANQRLIEKVRKKF